MVDAWQYYGDEFSADAAWMPDYNSSGWQNSMQADYGADASYADWSGDWNNNWAHDTTVFNQHSAYPAMPDFLATEMSHQGLASLQHGLAAGAQPELSSPLRLEDCLAKGSFGQESTSTDQSTGSKGARTTLPKKDQVNVSPIKVSPPSLVEPRLISASTFGLVDDRPPPGLPVPPGLQAPKMPTTPGLQLPRLPRNAPPGLEISDVPTPATTMPSTPLSLQRSSLASNDVNSTPPSPTDSIMHGAGAPTSISLQDSPDVEKITITKDPYAVTWQAVHFCKRLKAGLGRPLVSPTFSLLGMPEARLMVFPDARNTLDGLRGTKKQAKFVKLLASGPLHCALKLKMPSTDIPKLMFYLSVGNSDSGFHQQGPFSTDALGSSLHGCDDFIIDWLEAIDNNDCVTMKLEIVQA